MADTYGALTLPPDVSALPIGDPALSKLGSYLQSVLNSQLGAAWAELRPRAGDASLPVRAVLTHDPRRRSFNDKLLPALFVFRVKGEFARSAEQFDWDASNICVMWIYPPDTQEKDVPRAPFANAIAKTVRRALEAERYRSWVDSGDDDPLSASYDADADSILTAQTSSLSTASYAGASLDGAIGTSTMVPRRIVTVTTAPTLLPSYNTTDPIVFECVDMFGGATSIEVTLTEPLGGETLAVDQDVRRVVSVAFPTMLTVDGELSVGTSAVAGRGSNVRQRCGFVRCNLRSWAPMSFEIGVETARGKIVDRPHHDMVEMHIEAIETHDVDLDVADGVSPIAGSGTGLTVLQGEPFDDSGSFTIERTLD